MSSIGGGWTLIGEQGKYIALSPQRFIDSTFGLARVKQQQVTVRGSPGEQVNVMLVAPSASQLLQQQQRYAEQRRRTLCTRVLVRMT